MRLKVVAVVPPSLFNSNPCWKCAKSEIAALLPLRCKSCGSLQDLPLEDISYFDLLEVPEKLALDEEVLRSHFYHFSKQVHPDRFVGKPEPEPQYAERWSTSLNKAYQCLRDRTERAFYLLAKHSKGPAPKAQVPSELAESYFELQDLLSEGNRTPMVDFQKTLQVRCEALETEWLAIANRWNETPGSQEILSRLRNYLDLERFLKSMMRDIERKLAS